MSVAAYHPGTGASVIVTEEQLAHMRAAGWMSQAEHDGNQAEAAAAAAAAEKAAKSGKDK